MISRISNTFIPAVPSGASGFFHVKEEPANGSEWQLRVKRRIRKIAPFRVAAGFWSACENLVWGLTPGSSILLLALTILCLRMYLNLGHDYLNALLTVQRA